MFYPSFHALLYKFSQKGKIRYGSVATRIFFILSSFIENRYYCCAFEAGSHNSFCQWPIYYASYRLESVSMHFVRSQLGSGFKSRDLFEALEINSFISLPEAGWNTSVQMITSADRRYKQDQYISEDMLALLVLNILSMLPKSKAYSTFVTNLSGWHFKVWHILFFR